MSEPAWEAVIGLEVHVQLKTATKMFCRCPNRFGQPPNTLVCPVCLGYPGTLPVVNREAVELATTLALALGCTVRERSVFARKNYFYPDLPKGYQISQYDRPLAEDGRLPLTLHDKSIRIERLHLEEDAGKLLHEAHETDTFVDFNRTGVPLLEIVSEPDLRSPDDAYQYLVELKAILQYLDVSTCNMEEGSLRCDTNISLRTPGASALGIKVEVKNLNSFKAVKQALEHETKRQAMALEREERVPQETRLWDARGLKTEPLRSKEEAADYRYFPEPDLVPFVIDRALVERARGELPELPAQRRRRYEATHQLSAYDAAVLTQHQVLGELFEGALRAGAAAKPVANWIMGDLLGYLNAKGLEPEAVKLRPEWLAHLLQLIGDGTISGKMAKEVFLQSLERGMDPRRLVEEGHLRQIADPAALERIADAVLHANPKSVEDYAKGKTNAFTHLMGQAMKESQGKANPRQMAELLKRKLEKGVMMKGEESR
jgi:aspartyl-tRNA(Asn)/glutamyl-tRNA(Gln) amidotransferase subunit B